MLSRTHYLSLCAIIIFIALFFLTSCRKDAKYSSSYVIVKDGSYGLIDSLGKEIVSPRFINIEPIQKDGFALAVIDTIYTSMLDSFVLESRKIPVLNIKYGYVNNEDKFLFPKPSIVKIPIRLSSDASQAYNWFCQNFSFYGGLAIAQDTTTLKYGYIDLNGDTVITAHYQNACIFNQGRAAVQLPYLEGTNESHKWGLINPNGENIGGFIFNKLETPFNGRAIANIVYVGNKELNKRSPIFFNTLLVDQNAIIIKEKLDQRFQYVNFSKEGIAVAIPNKFGELCQTGYKFINRDGEFIKPLNVAGISKEQANAIIKRKHFLNVFFPSDVVFTDATRFTNGYAAVKLGDGWLFVDKYYVPRGNAEHPIFEDAMPFSHGLAGVKLNGKYGYIDSDFNIAIPCKYDSCAIAGKDLCKVYTGVKTENGYPIVSYVNRNNEIVWQNVNYESKLFEKNNIKHNGVWMDVIDYTYLGKDYSIIWLCLIPMVVILFVLCMYQYSRRIANFDIKESKSCINQEPQSIDERINDFFKN